MDPDYLDIPPPPIDPAKTGNNQRPVELSNNIKGVSFGPTVDAPMPPAAPAPPTPPEKPPEPKRSGMKAYLMAALSIIALAAAIGILYGGQFGHQEKVIFNILNTTQVANLSRINTTCSCLTKQQFDSFFNGSASTNQSAEYTPVTIVKNPQDLNGLGGFIGPPSPSLLESVKEFWFYDYAAPTNGSNILDQNNMATQGGSETLIETSNTIGVYTYITTSQPGSVSLAPTASSNGFTYTYFNTSYIGLDNKTHQTFNLVGYKGDYVAYVALGAKNTSMASPATIAATISSTI
jgi:hypothetical protein